MRFIVLVLALVFVLGWSSMVHYNQGRVSCADEKVGGQQPAEKSRRLKFGDVNIAQRRV